MTARFLTNLPEFIPGIKMKGLQLYFRRHGVALVSSNKPRNKNRTELPALSNSDMHCGILGIVGTSRYEPLYKRGVDKRLESALELGLDAVQDALLHNQGLHCFQLCLMRGCDPSPAAELVRVALDAANDRGFKPICDVNTHGPNPNHDLPNFWETLETTFLHRYRGYLTACYTILQRHLSFFDAFVEKETAKTEAEVDASP